MMKDDKKRIMSTVRRQSRQPVCRHVRNTSRDIGELKFPKNEWQAVRKMLLDDCSHHCI